MKKLLLIILLSGIMTVTNAQNFAIQTITAPSYICQADSFDVNITLGFANTYNTLDSINSSITPGLIKINLIMTDNGWGQMHYFQTIETIRLPVPSGGSYTILAEAFVNNQVRSALSTSTNVCTSGATGIPDKLPQIKAKLYPNPASDFLNLEIPDQASAKIQFTDLTGRTLKTHFQRSGNSRIDISDLPTGIYLLTILTEKGTQTFKVVKQ